jgi:hypothetical protein
MNKEENKRRNKKKKVAFPSTLPYPKYGSTTIFLGFKPSKF